MNNAETVGDLDAPEHPTARVHNLEPLLGKNSVAAVSASGGSRIRRVVFGVLCVLLIVGAGMWWVSSGEKWWASSSEKWWAGTDDNGIAVDTHQPSQSQSSVAGVEGQQVVPEPSLGLSDAELRQKVIEIVAPVLLDVIRISGLIDKGLEEARADRQQLRALIEEGSVRSEEYGEMIQTQMARIGELEAGIKQLSTRVENLKNVARPPVHKKAAPIKKTVAVAPAGLAERNPTAETREDRNVSGAYPPKRDSGFVLYAHTADKAFLRNMHEPGLTLVKVGSMLTGCGKVVAINGGSSPRIVTEGCADISDR